MMHRKGGKECKNMHRDVHVLGNSHRRCLSVRLSDCLTVGACPCHLILRKTAFKSLCAQLNAGLYSSLRRE